MTEGPPSHPLMIGSPRESEGSEPSLSSSQVMFQGGEMRSYWLSISWESWTYGTYVTITEKHCDSWERDRNGLPYPILLCCSGGKKPGFLSDGSSRKTACLNYSTRRLSTRNLPITTLTRWPGFT